MDSNALEWLKASNDDLEAIVELLNNPNLTNIASFHAQQSIEKSFKALLESKKIKIQKTHNLEKLHETVKDYINIENQNLLELINELYIDSRYPGDLGLLPNGKPTVKDVEGFYEFAKYIYEITKKQIN